MMLTFFKESSRQLIYSGIIAFIIFILPLILDLLGIETINLFILPYLIYRLTHIGIAVGLFAQILTFLIGWIVFFIIALIIKTRKTFELKSKTRQAPRSSEAVKKLKNKLFY